MLLPYRVKNPTTRFPAATIGIIGINVIVYLLTTEYFLFIRRDIILRYAFKMGESPAINAFTAMFLHADPFHLLGNMLFLWVFGRAVEDRLGIARYLGVYFVTGIVGDLLQALFDVMFTGSPHPVIGASGCIMGAVGAYWFLFPWSKVCVFYWLFWYVRGVWEVQAIWVIGLYFLMDLANGLAWGHGGGVANFAHVGGSLAGVLLCIVLKAKRDTVSVSEAKAVQADVGGLERMPLQTLQTMLQDDYANTDIIRALIPSALRLNDREAVDGAMANAGPVLIEKDPNLVAYYLVDLCGSPSIYQPVQLLKLASVMEQAYQTQQAMGLYRIVASIRETSPDVEMALYRMALCSWNRLHDANGAKTCLAEMHKRFPNGPMLPYGRELWRRISS